MEGVPEHVKKKHAINISKKNKQKNTDRQKNDFFDASGHKANMVWSILAENLYIASIFLHPSSL